jgi:hypothetical protein
MSPQQPFMQTFIPQAGISWRIGVEAEPAAETNRVRKSVRINSVRKACLGENERERGRE